MYSKSKAKPRSLARRKIEDISTKIDANERWLHIVIAATELFRSKGFVSTTMQDIADAVGILKGSLYYYIDTKEDLLFQILNGLHKDGEEIVALIKFGSADPLQQLRVYLKRAAIFAASNYDRLVIFHRDFQHVPANRQHEIISERELYANSVKALVKEAKAKGMTSPTLDVSLAAKLISGAVSSTHEWFRPDGRRPLEEAANEISELLTNTIRHY